MSASTPTPTPVIRRERKSSAKVRNAPLASGPDPTVLSRDQVCRPSSSSSSSAKTKASLSPLGPFNPADIAQGDLYWKWALEAFWGDEDKPPLSPLVRVRRGTPVPQPAVSAPASIDFEQTVDLSATITSSISLLPQPRSSSSLQLTQKQKSGETSKSFKVALGYALDAASCGCAPAATLIGYLHAHGILFDLDEMQALRYYTYSSAQKNALGDALLADFYLKGKGGVSRNPELVLRLLTRAAGNGSLQGLFELAFVYSNGLSPLVKKDPTVAIGMFTEAVECGHMKAAVELAKYHLQLRDDAKHIQGCIVLDKPTGVMMLQRAVETNKDREATFLLSECYRHGNGCEKDIKKAQRYVLDAADRGWPDALYNLGNYFALGIVGFRYDARLARYYLQAAKLKGSSRAAALLTTLPLSPLTSQPPSTT